MKNFLNKISGAALLTLAAATLSADASAEAKYVFYFIGDGMGMGHVNATETYTRDILKADSTLLMLRFPVASQVRTFSANKPVTDSAAAGTALSTGSKTNNYKVGVDPDDNELQSIAVDFMKAGYAVGVGSSVYGDDATPSAFYGHAADRNMHAQLSSQAANSGLTFLGAPVFKGMNIDGKETTWLADMQKAGYTLVKGFSTIDNMQKLPEKMLMLSDCPQGYQVGYTLDSIPGANTVQQLTSACLRQLESTGAPGFFMMIEDGNIDWAAHANDGGTVVKEVLNFQKAIDIAYKFYLQHPEETLIVVTADHDTGGLALGRRENRNPDLSLVDYQKISKDRFSDFWKEEMMKGREITWQEMETFLKENLGFWGVTKISDRETAELKASFEDTFIRRSGKDEKTLYNDFNLFTVKVYDIFNTRLGIGWTTTNHTGNFVPLYAIGAGAELFTSNLNNICVPKLIVKAALQSK